jgi:two-component system, response regulator RegA
VLRIFLLEDDESNRLTLSVLLEEDGFEVTVAASFAEATSSLRQPGAAYDLFLLDHSLGDGFGTDLIPAIRERFPAAKIVTLSGSLGGELASDAADLVLTKAMHFPELSERLRAVSGQNA